MAAPSANRRGPAATGEASARGRNSATQTGIIGEIADGIVLQGNNMSLSDFVANDNADDGVDVQGSRNVVRRGQANRNGEDGVDVNFGTGNQVVNVEARDNAAEGIEVSADDPANETQDSGVGDATNTQLTNNTALGNRRDICDSGTGTVLAGNAIGTPVNICKIDLLGTR